MSALPHSRMPLGNMCFGDVRRDVLKSIVPDNTS